MNPPEIHDGTGNVNPSRVSSTGPDETRSEQDLDAIQQNFAAMQPDIESIPYTPPEVVLRYVRPLAAMVDALLADRSRLERENTELQEQASYRAAAEADLARVNTQIVKEYEAAQWHNDIGQDWIIQSLSRISAALGAAGGSR